MLRKMRNEKGFTLIEIIAVLVILGILAAAAVPRYVSLQEEARASAAQAAIAEVKAQANQYYAVNTLRNGAPPPIASITTSVTTAPDVGPDFGVTAAVNGTNGINISVGTVRGIAITAVTGYWTMPQ